MRDELGLACTLCSGVTPAAAEAFRSLWRQQGTCCSGRSRHLAGPPSPLSTVAARLQNAVMQALMEQDRLREELVDNLGLCIKGVRMSPDNLKAFILWDSYSNQGAALEKELGRR